MHTDACRSATGCASCRDIELSISNRFLFPTKALTLPSPSYCLPPQGFSTAPLFNSGAAATKAACGATMAMSDVMIPA